MIVVDDEDEEVFGDEEVVRSLIETWFSSDALLPVVVVDEEEGEFDDIELDTGSCTAPLAVVESTTEGSPVLAVSDAGEGETLSVATIVAGIDIVDPSAGEACSTGSAGTPSRFARLSASHISHFHSSR